VYERGWHFGMFDVLSIGVVTAGFTVCAETAPRAITRAFILAMEGIE